jgi:hypothetical protein
MEITFLKAEPLLRQVNVYSLRPALLHLASIPLQYIARWERPRVPDYIATG